MDLKRSVLQTGSSILDNKAANSSDWEMGETIVPKRQNDGSKTKYGSLFISGDLEIFGIVGALVHYIFQPDIQ